MPNRFNRDDVITRAQYQHARADRFDKADRNEDGAVSRDDFKRLARFRPDAAERLEALMAEADANREDKIDRAEIAAFKTKAAELQKQR